jgi:hypothetical protein
VSTRSQTRDITGHMTLIRVDVSKRRIQGLAPIFLGLAVDLANLRNPFFLVPGVLSYIFQKPLNQKISGCWYPPSDSLSSFPLLSLCPQAILLLSDAI